jgi:hypothetical protein
MVSGLAPLLDGPGNSLLGPLVFGAGKFFEVEHDAICYRDDDFLGSVGGDYRCPYVVSRQIARQ